MRLNKKAPLSAAAKKAVAKAKAAEQDMTFYANIHSRSSSLFHLCVEEYQFHPTRKWRFDYAWPRYLVAVEKDGGVWSGGKHGRGSGIVKDHEKQNAAAVLGWRILRCTPQQLTDPAFAQTVLDALNYKAQ